MDALCQELAERSFNLTLANVTNLTTVAQPSEDGIWDDLSDLAADVAELFDNGTKKIDLRTTFSTFKYSVERYVFTAACAIGLLLNALSVLLLCKDTKMRRLARLLLTCVVAMDTCHQAGLIAVMQLRHWDPLQVARRQMEVRGCVTTVMSAFDALCLWTLYLTAIDSYRSVRYYQKPSTLYKMTRVPHTLVAMTTLVLLFHVPFLPPVRLLLYHYIPPGTWYSFDPCTTPIENHWDLSAAGVTSGDLYYILYYSLGYLLVHYMCPGLAILSRDKDNIDVIHAVSCWSGKTTRAVVNAAITASCVSVICNVTVVTMTPKLTLLLLRQINFALQFMGPADAVFKFLNVLANGFSLLRGISYLPIFIMYNFRIRQIAYDNTVGRIGVVRKYPMTEKASLPEIRVDAV